MTGNNVIEQIKSIEEQIKSLPIGYISAKTISGKTYYYHQWSENGKKESKYLKTDEVDELREKIELRKQLQKQLNDIKGKRSNIRNSQKYKTNVVMGFPLKNMIRTVEKFGKRDIFKSLKKYLYNNDYNRVCAIYGLRRTGKTTMLFQALADMSESDFERAVYIKMRSGNKMSDLTLDLEVLYNSGYKFAFIDEITLADDFIDSAALLSDIYAPMGMKIVLSGTDSLGFWFAEGNELYDRVMMIHTTFIPFREYSRLLGIDSVDEYIRYGGTLRMGEIDFDDDDLMSSDASFRDDESTRRYIDTAICKNIQHSLKCFENGSYFKHLYELYDANELTSAINRIIEDINHRFLISVIEKEFRSHDLGISAKNLRNDRNAENRTDILDSVDKDAITKRLMDILEIKNSDSRTIKITNEHITEIKQYLKALDLIVDCPIEQGNIGIKSEEHILFAQPGMRYCQAQALVYSIMKDELFISVEPRMRNLIAERILEEVRGRMLEDIVLLETSKALGKKYDIFKLQFDRGEFDMVIYDKENLTCSIFEIKHSSECVEEQTRHLINDEFVNQTKIKFGDLVGRYVLYLGEDQIAESGVIYLNAERFLIDLPKLSILQNS